MACDDFIFIARDDISGDAAGVRADTRPVSPVRCFIQIQPEPATTFANRGSNRPGVLSNPGGEDDPIQAAKCSRERSDMTYCLVAENLDCELRAWILASQ